MIRFGMARSILVVAVLDAVCMCAMNHALKPPRCPRSHMLFIGNATSEFWQRSVEGARDAAKAVGVELDVEMPTPNDLDEQTSIVRRINSGGYNGVAMSLASPESEIDPINDVASQTKLVTVDRDGCKSRRMCHVAYSQTSAGQHAARLVRDQLSRPGKVALLATALSDATRNNNVSERLAGFKEEWRASEEDNPTSNPIIEPTADSALAAVLVDPQVAFIVAFDAKTAAFALKTLAAQPAKHRVPMIAFDPNRAIFDAIDDGRVLLALFDDPYRSGFAAIQRLIAYQSNEKAYLPVPGYGSFYLVSEVVRKENLADVRRRIRS
jgi:ribose transport system substrate-binding protein